MSARIRKAIGEKIAQIIQNTRLADKIVSRLTIPKTVKSAADVELQLCEDDVKSVLGEATSILLEKLKNSSFEVSVIENVSMIAPSKAQPKPCLKFKLNYSTFVEDVLSLKFFLQPAIQSSGVAVFEYSSPNIAKPFHVGHLRSTIIGNVLANIYKHLGHNVVKLNYLGDWGTQFGMLQVGVELEKLTDEQMQTNPIENLYKAYVRANTEAKRDPSITEKARKLFNDLESDTTSPEVQMQWLKYRMYTIAELERVYQRVGVVFDEYHWESQYSHKYIGFVLDELQRKDLINCQPDGRKTVTVGKREVPVIKSDGSTLYLVRDIAALIDRFKKFKFEKMFYVVENGQTDHFNALFTITSAINPDAGSRARHIKFGRIHGMSTRKGNAVFLNDLLDEARDKMLEKQAQSPTTKVNVSSLDTSVADVLGVSAVIINDLKQRRQRDYDFDWNNALQMNGDTGIKLQYTHCRLSNLLENMSHIQPKSGVDSSLLKEPEALELIVEIAKFHQSILKAAETLEACVLVTYLFSLCNSTSRALKRLKVKDEPSKEVQLNRLLLFAVTREVLGCGMKLLGLKPLTKM